MNFLKKLAKFLPLFIFLFYCPNVVCGQDSGQGRDAAFSSLENRLQEMTARYQKIFSPLASEGSEGRNSGSSVSRRRPLTTTEKGLLIAFTTLVSAPIAILGRGGQVAFWAWRP